MAARTRFYRTGSYDIGKEIMSNPNRKLIYDLDVADLSEELKELGQPEYRVKQIWQGLYINLWSSFDEFSTLPASLRAQLADRYDICHLEPIKWIASEDGETTKTLFQVVRRIRD